MKQLLTIVVLAVFVFSGWSAYAHGTDAGTSSSGSMGMTKMMDMMHGHMDENRGLDCNKASDEEMMEHGEEMMEEMMGHEDHERIEEEMEKDMQDHDSMHMMMGMWSSGCIGDEAMNTLMERYGVPGHLDNGYQGSVQAQASWSSAVVGLILGAIGGWLGNNFITKKSKANSSQ